MMTEEMSNNAKLYSKKLAVMKSVHNVKKDGKNTHHNFDFVSREEVYSKIRAAMIENNLVVDGSIINVSDSDKEGSRIITFEFILIDAETGYSVSRTWSQPGYEMAKSKNGTYVDPYGFAKAETYAMKQWLMTTFLLTSKEYDEVEQENARSAGEIINLFHGETFIDVAESATGLEREQIQAHLRNEFTGQPKDPVAWLKSLVDYKASLVAASENGSGVTEKDNKIIEPDFGKEEVVETKDDPPAQEEPAKVETPAPQPPVQKEKAWEEMDAEERKAVASAFVERLAKENNREPEYIRSILKNGGTAYNPDSEEALTELVVDAVSKDTRSVDAGFNGTANLRKNEIPTKDEIAAVEDIVDGDEPFVMPDENDPVPFVDSDVSGYGIDDEDDLDNDDVTSELDELDELAELGDFT
jgi:hypothetical protein